MKHVVIAIGLLLSLAAFSPSAHAEQITISWTAAHQWMTDARTMSRAESSSPSTRSGWQRSHTDVMTVMSAFPNVQLRPGYILRAFVRNDGANAIGNVVGMPESAGYPDPDETMIDSSGSLRVRSSITLDQAIRSDGTPQGYLQASLMIRELGDFGARWHGTSWSNNSLMTKALWPNMLTSHQGIDVDGSSVDMFTGYFAPSEDATKWKWTQAPGQMLPFAPTVTFTSGAETTVQFTIYKPIYGESFATYLDSYDADGYRLRNDMTLVATGPRYVVF